MYGIYFRNSFTGTFNSMFAKADSNISQGSVMMFLSCGGSFDNNFIAYLLLSVCIGQYQC